MNKIKIAIQKEGRLSKKSKEFLLSLGLDFDLQSKSLALDCLNKNVSIIQLRDDDIPKYVAQGLVDLGIVGLDVFRESRAKAKIFKRLSFCKCKLVIAIPKNSEIKSVEDLVDKKIATSYSKILGDYLKRKRIQVKIIEVMGSAEVMPYIQAADAVCDITETGNTLKEFDLIPLVTILESEAVLIKSPKSSRSKSDFLQKLT